MSLVCGCLLLVFELSTIVLLILGPMLLGLGLFVRGLAMLLLGHMFLLSLVFEWLVLVPLLSLMFFSMVFGLLDPELTPMLLAHVLLVLERCWSMLWFELEFQVVLLSQLRRLPGATMFEVLASL